MAEGKPCIRIKHVMTHALETIERTATVREAIDKFDKVGVSSLVVLRRNDEDEIGVLTVRDVAARVIAEGKSADRVNVYEAMTKPVLTVDAEMNVRYAVRLMSRFGLSRAVVTAGREPVGLVTLRDIVLGHGSNRAERPEPASTDQ